MIGAGSRALQDDHNLVRISALEVRLDKFVSAALWRLDNWSIPADSLLLDPGLKLFRSTSRLTG